jgi:hypothetical protein
MGSLRSGLLAMILLVPALNAGVILSQGFDDISTLAAAGWTTVNNSAPAGITNWYQGDPAIFNSETGAPNSYVAANFEAAAFGGNISLWLLSPVITLDNGVAISFFTRTETTWVAADRLELRASVNGTSGNVGASDTSVGDFTTLLLTINPALTVSGYPNAWTQFTAILSGLGGPVSGRFAFRYLVPDTSVNGDYIGIDTVTATSPASVPEPSSLHLGLLGLGSLAAINRRRGRISLFPKGDSRDNK